MRIAIDASQLVPGESVGTQVYLYNLIHTLAQLDLSNIYTIYFKHSMNDTFFRRLVSANPNFSFKVLDKSLSWTQKSLSQMLSKDEPDILLCPWQTMPIFHPKNVKIVSIIHALGEYKKHQSGPTLYTCLFSDKLIAVSEFTKSKIIKDFHIKATKICVAYEGVDTNFFTQKDATEVSKVKEKYSIKDDYIFFVGTLSTRKNIANMLQAFQQVLHSANVSKNLCFVLGGNIPNDYSYFLDLPQELGITANVKFLGKVAAADLPALYSGALFFAFVSQTEGFGLPVLEAMACGTPVLTSTKGALPEVGGNAALYADPFNIKEISTQMMSLIQSDTLRKELVVRANNHLPKFAWKNGTQKVLEVFESLK